MTVCSLLRRTVALEACLTICVSLAQGQSKSSALWRPYVPGKVPPVSLVNSSRLNKLIHSGNLYLTLRDAVALVLENNLDIEVARYDPIAAVWDLQRAQAGEFRPFSISAPLLVGAAAPGQGVTGSELAATGSVATQSGANGISRSPNATISAIGPIPQNLDPIFAEATVFSRTSRPQTNEVPSLESALLSATHASTASLQQGFLSGGSVTLSYSDRYLRENARTDFLNPSVAPSLSISFQHNLLRGFGVDLNARNINVAKINLRISDLAFRLQVLNAVVQTQSLYDSLLADFADVKDKRAALELAEALYEDDKKRVQAGALVKLDVIAAESAVAAAERDLFISQSSLQQQELQLKNLVSRTGPADPLLKNVSIIPIDEMILPENDDLPPLETMMQQALANRADLAIEKVEIEAAELSALGTRNGVLPSLEILGSTTNAGLAGTRRSTATSLDGGIGTALEQVARRDYPEERITASFQIPLLNRIAQADYGLDQLSMRQAQHKNKSDISRVQVDLLTSLATLQQVRARCDAAVQYRMLESQLLNSAREAYSVGKSSSYEVMQAQRALAAAQYAEVVGRVSWRNAQVTLDMTLGTTLEKNHVSIADAKTGGALRSPVPH